MRLERGSSPIATGRTHVLLQPVSLVSLGNSRSLLNAWRKMELLSRAAFAQALNTLCSLSPSAQLALPVLRLAHLVLRLRLTHDSLTQPQDNLSLV